MVILNGHSSHVNNIKFIECCMKMNIDLISLPTLTTHVLQPLDIGIFTPMGNSYQKQLEDFLRHDRPNWAMHKGDFYPMYHKARAKAMTERNILSAWRASGIIPFNRHKVLSHSGFQIGTAQSNPMNQQRSAHRPFPTRAETSSKLDIIRQEANRVEFDDASRTLLNKVLDLCSKANAQSVLDTAMIMRLEANTPSTTYRLQNKGGLVHHTSVLSNFIRSVRVRICVKKNWLQRRGSHDHKEWSNPKRLQSGETQEVCQGMLKIWRAQKNKRMRWTVMSLVNQ